MNTLHFIGIDVDDTAFHVSVVDQNGTILKNGIRTRRDMGALLKEIKKHSKNNDVLVGYEATYVGYTLARFLRKKKIDCCVIVPTSIGKSPNERVKNDRIDSLRLALGLKRGEFNFVNIPTVDEESDRQLLRSRAFLVQQRSDLKRHILNQCRVFDLDYKAQSGAKEYWTAKHRNWLDASLKTLPPSAHVALSSLLQQLESFERQIQTLEAEIQSFAETNKYKDRVDALMLFKGISLLTATTIITEIRDIKRFSHPKSLVAYLGLDIAEYSSGGKQIQFGISKMGNRRVRTALVESCQRFGTSKSPSKRSLAQRKGADPNIIKIADRCQERLYKKGHRLLAREKHRNLVKVAVARELVGFIWEALTEVA